MTTETKTQMSGETDNVRQLKDWSPKTIGIIGSRRRKSKDDYHQLETTLMAIYNEGDIIVSGGCPQGGDFFGEQLARRLGTTIIIHHANWDKYGRSAGYERNGKIALDADVLLALVANDRKGGTEDTIRKYQDLGKGNLCVLSREALEDMPKPTPYKDYGGMPSAMEPPRPDTCPLHTDPDHITGGNHDIEQGCTCGEPAQEPPTKTTVAHITQPYDIYIGRAGHGQDGYFGNPHPVGKPCRHCGGITHDRSTAIEAYRADFIKRIETDDAFRQKINDLAGKRLGCFCAPRACHGDVIADYLNAQS